MRAVSASSGATQVRELLMSVSGCSCMDDSDILCCRLRGYCRISKWDTKMMFRRSSVVTQFAELSPSKRMKYCSQSLVDCWLLPAWWLTMTYYSRCSWDNAQTIWKKKRRHKINVKCEQKHTALFIESFRPGCVVKTPSIFIMRRKSLKLSSLIIALFVIYIQAGPILLACSYGRLTWGPTIGNQFCKQNARK